MSRWRNPDRSVLADVWMAVHTERGQDPLDGQCNEPDPVQLGGWCSRAAHHTGRHIAIGTQADAVFAAWPGEHEPTLADLEA